MAAVVVLVTGAVAPQVRSAASPGDPLGTFGSSGVLAVTAPAGCTACPQVESPVGDTLLETRGTSTILGYSWSNPVEQLDERPATGTALAVTVGGAAPWRVQVTGPGTGIDRTLLAVGTQPSTSQVVAVVSVTQRGATIDDPDVPLRQEIRRYSSAGILDATVELPDALHGTWSVAAVAPDGSVVAAVETSGAGGLPLTAVRRYDLAGSSRWTAALPLGDVVDALDVSASGTVVAAGSRADVAEESYDGLVAAWSDAGSPVSGFGAGGVRVFAAPAGFGRGFADVDVEGSDVAMVGDDQWQTDDDDDLAPGAALVVRLRDGAPLVSFSGDGIAERRWGGDDGQRVDVSGVLIDGTRTLISGAQVASDGYGARAVLSRYLATGAVDGSFAIDGSAAATLDGLAPVAGGYAAVGPPVSAGGAWAVPVRAYAAAGPGSTGPPPPTGLAVSSAGAQRATFGWTQASGATGYELSVDVDGDGLADLINDLSTASSAPVTAIPPDRLVRASLRSRGPGGLGPATTWSAPAIPPFRSVDAFSDRQLRDVLGRAPTAAELSQWRTALLGGATPSSRISAALDLPVWAGVRAPVIRLYRAYFLRVPDTAGLDYWVAQSRSGRSLAQISQAFAASPEFRTLYGTLTNRQFVERIYQNILGRPGEPAGIAYWTGELDARRRTRGTVMTGFSESPEYRTRSQPTVDVVHVFTAMVRRVPASAEAQLWAPVLAGGRPRTDVIAYLLGTPEYDQRIP